MEARETFDFTNLDYLELDRDRENTNAELELGLAIDDILLGLRETQTTDTFLGELISTLEEDKQYLLDDEFYDTSEFDDEIENEENDFIDHVAKLKMHAFRYIQICDLNIADLIKDKDRLSKIVEGSKRYLYLKKDNALRAKIKNAICFLLSEEFPDIVEDKTLIERISFLICFWSDEDLAQEPNLLSKISEFVLNHARSISEYLVKNRIELPKNKQYVNDAFNEADNNKSKEKNALKEDLRSTAEFLSARLGIPIDDERIQIFKDFVKLYKNRDFTSSLLGAIEIKSIFDSSFVPKPRNKKSLIDQYQFYFNRLVSLLEDISSDFKLNLSDFLERCAYAYKKEGTDWITKYIDNKTANGSLSESEKLRLEMELLNFFKIEFSDAMLVMRSFAHYYEGIDTNALLNIFLEGNVEQVIDPLVDYYSIDDELLMAIQSQDLQVSRVSALLRTRLAEALGNDEVDEIIRQVSGIVASTDSMSTENKIRAILSKHYKFLQDSDFIDIVVNIILDHIKSDGKIDRAVIEQALKNAENYVPNMHEETLVLIGMLEDKPDLQEQLINLIRSVSDETDMDLNTAWQVNSWDELYRSALHYMLDFYEPLALNKYKNQVNESIAKIDENTELSPEDREEALAKIKRRYTYEYLYNKFPQCAVLLPLTPDLIENTYSFSDRFNCLRALNKEMSDEEIYYTIQGESFGKKYLCTIKISDIDTDSDNIRIYMMDGRFRRMYDLCKNAGDESQIVEKIKEAFGDQSICIPIELDGKQYSEELIELLINPAVPHANDFLKMMEKKSFWPTDAATNEFMGMARMLLHLEYGSLLLKANFYKKTLTKLYGQLQQKIAGSFDMEDGYYIMKIKDPDSDEVIKARITIGNIKTDSSLIRKIFTKDVSNIAGSITDLFRIRVELPDEIEDPKKIDAYAKYALGSVMSVFGTDFIENTCKNSFNSGKTSKLSIGNFMTMKTVLKWLTTNPNSPDHPHMMNIEVQVCHKYPKDYEDYSAAQKEHSRANAFGVAPDKSFANSIIGLIDIINTVGEDGRIFAHNEEVGRILESRRDPYSWMVNVAVSALTDPRNINVVTNLMKKERDQKLGGRKRIADFIETIKNSPLFKGKLSPVRIQEVEKLYSFAGDKITPGDFRNRRSEIKDSSLINRLENYSPKDNLSSVLLSTSVICDPRNMYSLRRILNKEGARIFEGFFEKIKADIKRLKNNANINTNDIWMLFRLSEHLLILEELIKMYREEEKIYETILAAAETSTMQAFGDEQKEASKMLYDLRKNKAKLSRETIESFWSEKYPEFSYNVASNIG